MPLFDDIKPAHAGVWRAIPGIDNRETRTLAASVGKYGARYSLSMHAYSNVRMAANLTSGEGTQVLGEEVAHPLVGRNFSLNSNVDD